MVEVPKDSERAEILVTSDLPRDRDDRNSFLHVDLCQRCAGWLATGSRPVPRRKWTSHRLLCRHPLTPNIDFKIFLCRKLLYTYYTQILIYTCWNMYIVIILKPIDPFRWHRKMTIVFSMCFCWDGIWKVFQMALPSWRVIFVSNKTTFQFLLWTDPTDPTIGWWEIPTICHGCWW